MLSLQGRRAAHAAGRATELDGYAGHLELSEARVFGLHNHPVVPDLRIAHHLGDLAHRCGQNVGGNDLLQQLVAREVLAAGRDQPIELVLVAKPVLGTRKAWVLGERDGERLTEVAEEFVRRAGDAQPPTVPTLIHARGCKEVAAVSRSRHHLPGEQVALQHRGLRVGQYVEEREVDALAFSGGIPDAKGREDAGRHAHRGHDVHKRRGDADRRRARIAVPRDEARVALRQKIDARPARIGTVGAEGRNAHPDHVLSVATDRLVVDPETRESGFPHVCHKRVRAADEAREDRLRGGLGEIKHDGPLVAVEGKKRRPLSQLVRTEMSALVAVV